MTLLRRTSLSSLSALRGAVQSIPEQAFPCHETDSQFVGKLFPTSRDCLLALLHEIPVMTSCAHSLDNVVRCQYRNELYKFKARGTQERTVLGLGAFFPSRRHQHVHIHLQNKRLQCPPGQDHSLKKQHFSLGLHALLAAGEYDDGALIIKTMDHLREQIGIVVSGNRSEGISTHDFASARYAGSFQKGWRSLHDIRQVKQHTIEGGMGLEDGCQYLPVPSSDIDERPCCREIIGNGDRLCNACCQFRHEIIKERRRLGMLRTIFPPREPEDMLIGRLARFHAVQQRLPNVPVCLFTIKEHHIAQGARNTGP